MSKSAFVGCITERIWQLTHEAAAKHAVLTPSAERSPSRAASGKPPSATTGTCTPTTVYDMNGRDYFRNPQQREGSLLAMERRSYLHPPLRVLRSTRVATLLVSKSILTIILTGAAGYQQHHPHRSSSTSSSSSSSILTFAGSPPSSSVRARYLRSEGRAHITYGVIYCRINSKDSLKEFTAADSRALITACSPRSYCRSTGSR